jgi:hypothetical protein
MRVEQVRRDREAENAVAEELQPLVGRLTVGRRRRVREREPDPFGVQLLDQLPQAGGTLGVASSGVTGAT